jgi:hypothetical protein
MATKCGRGYGVFRHPAGTFATTNWRVAGIHALPRGGKAEKSTRSCIQCSNDRISAEGDRIAQLRRIDAGGLLHVVIARPPG